MHLMLPLPWARPGNWLRNRTGEKGFPPVLDITHVAACLRTRRARLEPCPLGDCEAGIYFRQIAQFVGQATPMQSGRLQKKEVPGK